MVTSALELLVKAMLKIIMISSLYSAILLFGTGVPNDSLDILPNKSMYESTKKEKFIISSLSLATSDVLIKNKGKVDEMTLLNISTFPLPIADKIWQVCFKSFSYLKFGFNSSNT